MFRDAYSVSVMSREIYHHLGVVNQEPVTSGAQLKLPTTEFLP